MQLNLYICLALFIHLNHQKKKYSKYKIILYYHLYIQLLPAKNLKNVR